MKIIKRERERERKEERPSGFSVARLKNRMNTEDVHFFLKEADFKARGYALYGAGYQTEKVLLPVLENYGLLPDRIVDTNPEKQGKTLAGIPIDSPGTLQGYTGVVIVSSGKMCEMGRACEQMGINDWIVPSALQHFCCSYAELGCSYARLASRQADAVKTYNLFQDTLSRNIFSAIYAFMTLHEGIDFAKYYEPRQYFCADLVDRIDYSHFIDVGMYTGDTVDDWIQYGQTSAARKYVGIECSETSMHYAQEHIHKMFPALETTFYCMAASDTPGTINFFSRNRSNGNFILERLQPSAYTQTVRMATLDSLQLAAPTVIKADIEGSELAMLRGALQTLKTFRPALLIAVYHRIFDCIDIPLFIHNLGLGYRFYLRHHTRRYGETVLYAIPEEL